MESSLPGEILEALRSLTSIARFEKELPSELDRTFLDMVKFFRGATRRWRQEVTEAIPIDKGLAILERGIRLAVLAERQANPQLLVDSLVAHAIEGARRDPRENILRLALVTHIAKKLGVDDHGIFEEAAAVSGPEVASLLLEFVNRSASMKTLKSADLEEIQTPEGVDYRQPNRRSPRPKKARS